MSLVVLAHAGAPGFSGGYVGVDVFFVLSGYLISGLLIEERLATGRIRYLEFLARRLRRLLPAMLTMLLLVLAIASVLLTAFEMRMQARSLPFAAAWISNFFFAFGERDYFQALQEDDLFLHTWSLGVEEQFYLLWPWLVLVLVGLRIRDQRQTSLARNMLVALSAIAVTSFVICLRLTESNSILAFYMMPTRIWQFAAGAIVFVGLHMRPAKPGAASVRWALLSGLTGLALVFGSSYLLDDSVAYPGWYAVAPSIGAVLIIAAGALSRRNVASRVLEARPMVWVGDRSYSIYLWHWPALILGSSMGIADSTTGVIGIVALSVALAMFSYRYIEYPFWKGTFRTVIPRHAIPYALAAILLSMTAFFALERTVFGERVAQVTAPEYDPRMDFDTRVYKAGLDCDTGWVSPEIVPCSLGNRGAPGLAILIGDSVGAQWSPAMEAVYSSPDWEVKVLTKSGCAIVDKTYYYDKVGGDYLVCDEWRDRALDFIADAGAEIVVIGSSTRYDFTAGDWTEGTARVLERIAPVAERVVVIPGIPRITFDGPSCLEDPWRFSFRLIDGKRECEEALRTTLHDDVARYLQASATGFENVAVLEMGDVVCPEGRCAARTMEGVAVFRDSDHLTAAFARSLAPVLRERLAASGASPEKPAPDISSH